MKTKLAVIAAAAGLLFIATTMSAHHSFAGTYLEDAPPVNIEGTLVAFLVRNPHSFVHVEDDKRKDPKTGEPIRWSIEWGAAGPTGAAGRRTGSLKVGDKVKVVGSPGATRTTIGCGCAASPAVGRIGLSGGRTRRSTRVSRLGMIHQASQKPRAAACMVSLIAVAAATRCTYSPGRRRGEAGGGGGGRGGGGGAASHSGGIGSHRPDRLLGFAGDGRLAVSHGDSRQGRYASVPNNQGKQAGRQLGSGQGRGRRRAVQVLRRRGIDARARAPAHHLGGREHSQDRFRRGNPDPAVALRRAHAARRRFSPGFSVADWDGVGGRGRGVGGGGGGGGGGGRRLQRAAACSGRSRRLRPAHAAGCCTPAALRSTDPALRRRARWRCRTAAFVPVR